MSDNTTIPSLTLTPQEDEAAAAAAAQEAAAVPGGPCTDPDAGGQGRGICGAGFGAGAD